jgi:hypothetical protein
VDLPAGCEGGQSWSAEHRRHPAAEFGNRINAFRHQYNLL